MSVIIFVIKGLSYILAGLLVSALIIGICLLVFTFSLRVVQLSVDAVITATREFKTWAKGLFKK